MIRIKEIRSQEVHLYSIGQMALALDRHNGSMRRMESDGTIPEGFTRFDNGYRAYTEHERNILIHFFGKYSLRQGRAVDPKFTEELAEAFSQLHAYYKGEVDELPESASNAKKARSPFRN